MFYILDKAATDESINALVIVLNTILRYIRIIAPILLVVLISVDIFKAVISNDEDMLAKVVSTARRRIIACIVIFFIPTIVRIVMSKVYYEVDMNEEDYQKILAVYDQVVDYKKIDTTDDTKSTDISSLGYDINKNSKEEIDKKEKTEFDFYKVGDNITRLMFSSGIDYLDTIKVIYNGEETQFRNLKIKYDDIVVNSSIDNENYIIVNVSLYGDKNYIVDYYYKKTEDSYYLDYIKIDDNDSLKNYMKDIVKNEQKGVIKANNKYAAISTGEYDYTRLNNIKDSTIKTIYNKNINNIVILKTYKKDAIVARATGFFISDGIIVTSWSFVESSLMVNNDILVSDISSNNYKILGVVSIDKDLDICVLKLTRNVKRSITIGNTESIKKNDPVIAVVSKTGFKLTTQSGIVLSSDDNIVSLLPLSKNDWGSPLFNEHGEVIGINTTKIINSNTSIASSLDKVKELQYNINRNGYKKTSYTKLSKIKSTYFNINNNKEEVINTIDKKIWNEYKKIGNIEKSIELNLIKAGYYDNVLSLRYENKASSFVDSFSYATDFLDNLSKSGYKLSYDGNSKKIMTKGNNKVILMKEFNYLIIVIEKGSIL